MHHLAHIMTKLCQGREQDNAGWEVIPVYDSSGDIDLRLGLRMGCSVMSHS